MVRQKRAKNGQTKSEQELLLICLALGFAVLLGRPRHPGFQDGYRFWFDRHDVGSVARRESAERVPKA
jgi:hypothetical protein